MPKSLGRVVLLLVALAAVVPFFHADEHPEGCAVCTFAAAGNAQLTPDAFVLSGPVLDFCGLSPVTVDSCHEAGIPVRGSRAPPTEL